VVSFKLWIWGILTFALYSYQGIAGYVYTKKWYVWCKIDEISRLSFSHTHSPLFFSLFQYVCLHFCLSACPSLCFLSFGLSDFFSWLALCHTHTNLSVSWVHWQQPQPNHYCHCISQLTKVYSPMLPDFSIKQYNLNCKDNPF
jgi:hypothetical protein